jgi:peptide/nickel transport system substrate-binding protein
MESEEWNIDEGNMGTRMNDAAWVYANSYKAMKYFESVKGTVGNPLNPVMIDVYNSHLAGCKNQDGQNRDNAFFNFRATGSFGGLGTHLEQEKAVGGTATICEKTSSVSQQDAPINREYHELGHYLQNDMYYPASNLLSNRGTPHAGYANDGTNDSLVEGFASFVAMLVAEYHDEMEGGLPKYPLGTHRYNLEQDFRVWGDNVRMFRLDDGRVVSYFSPDRRNDEEWAVAGLLWDIHDRGQEFHVSLRTSAANDPNELWAPISEVYNVTRDNVALFDHHILDNIRSAKPMNLVNLYSAFSGDVSSQDLDMVFISHGAFGDVSKRDLVHSVGESVGPTGSKEAPDRPVRSSPYPMLNGSYFSAETDATFEVKFAHREPYSFYDYSYSVNMTKGEPAYFEMPPSYYPSVAQFFTISPSGQLSDDSSLTINSTEYWSYIYSKPQENAIFKTIEVTASQQPIVPVSQSDNSTGSTPSQPSGCLIATAAFGSELTPQVQFLRNFRDNHILSTASGSSFMNVFNAWYYSFSPQVADYEREQPWLQQTVRIAIYPLLGILQVAEKAYAVLPGEFGSISAGLVASSLMGAVYLSPAALAIRQVRKNRLDYRIAILVIAAVSGSVVFAVMANNGVMLMVTTALLVVSTLAISAIYAAKAIWKLLQFRKK